MKCCISAKLSQTEKSPGEWLPSSKIVAEYPTEIGVGNEKRQNQLMREAIYGINGGYANLLDVGVTFSGKKHAQFAATLAIGGSKIDPKNRLIFFYNHQTAAGSPFQIYTVAGITYPTVPVLDFKKSLDIETFTNYDMVLKYGKVINGGAVINAQGRMEQTKERREYLRHTPMVKLCESEIAKGNHLGPACENATISANMMDSLNVQINYNNVGDMLKLWTSNVYAYMRHQYFYNIKEDWFNPTSKPGSISVSVRLNPELTKLNGHIFTPSVNIYIENVLLSYWSRTYIAMNPTVPIHNLFTNQIYDNHSKFYSIILHLFY